MNFHRIYVEKAIRSHPRSEAILNSSPKAEIIECDRYGEVFNPRSQNFRFQKTKPSLILAKKQGQRVLSTPPDYGLGADRHFYFSHMLNCLYDCRYCFLQGMYQSANYVLFPNYEDFIQDIENTVEKYSGEKCFFFSGYDCDSLAMESMTEFAKSFLPYFKSQPRAWLELRTKSVNISTLLEQEPIENVVIAFSLNPDSVAKSLEYQAPPLSARLKAMAKLAKAGWKIGLRIDPIICVKDAIAIYSEFLNTIWESIPLEAVHSATLGSFRAPIGIFKKMETLYPEEPLFIRGLKNRNGMTCYEESMESSLRESIFDQLRDRLPADRIFSCQ